jgi:hypothetical protein
MRVSRLRETNDVWKSEGSDHRKWYPKWPVGSLFVLHCTFVFEIVTDIGISKWLISVVKYHLFPSVSVTLCSRIAPLIRDMLRSNNISLKNMVLTVTWLFKNHSLQNHSVQTKSNFKVYYRRAHCKWLSRGMLVTQSTHTCHHISMLKTMTISRSFA